MTPTMGTTISVFAVRIKNTHKYKNSQRYCCDMLSTEVANDMTELPTGLLSFLTGMGMAIDLGATMFRGYDFSVPPHEADRTALLHDWTVVGDTLRSAMGTFSDER